MHPERALSLLGEAVAAVVCVWGRSATGSAGLILNCAALHNMLSAPLRAAVVCLGVCLGSWRSLLRHTACPQPLCGM